VAEVVMTRQEQAAVVNANPGISATWMPHHDESFVRLKAKPCPYLAGHRCTVYAARPYACRRYGCLRTDPSQPWVDGPPQPVTRDDRRSLVLMQRKGQQWARTHGWTED